MTLLRVIIYGVDNCEWIETRTKICNQNNHLALHLDLLIVFRLTFWNYLKLNKYIYFLIITPSFFPSSNVKSMFLNLSNCLPVVGMYVIWYAWLTFDIMLRYFVPFQHKTTAFICIQNTIAFSFQCVQKVCMLNNKMQKKSTLENNVACVASCSIQGKSH